MSEPREEYWGNRFGKHHYSSRRGKDDTTAHWDWHKEPIGKRDGFYDWSSSQGSMLVKNYSLAPNLPAPPIIIWSNPEARLNNRHNHSILLRFWAFRLSNLPQKVRNLVGTIFENLIDAQKQMLILSLAREIQEQKPHGGPRHCQPEKAPKQPLIHGKYINVSEWRTDIHLLEGRKE